MLIWVNVINKILFLLTRQMFQSPHSGNTYNNDVNSQAMASSDTWFSPPYEVFSLHVSIKYDRQLHCIAVPVSQSTDLPGGSEIRHKWEDNCKKKNTASGSKGKSFVRF